jgi:hypothetical protein
MAAAASAKELIAETLPVEEQVRLRAYELYISRGNESGSDLDDWLHAEQEILLARNPQTVEV